MSLDSPEDDGVNDPTKPSQEVIKHDTTAAADLAADTILYSEDNEDVQDKKKAGEKRSFPWTPHLRTKESSTQRGRHLSLSGTSPLRELTIKLCREYNQNKDILVIITLLLNGLKCLLRSELCSISPDSRVKVYNSTVH